ncbi:zinc finger protein 557-like [Peromyscus californicus insignis]|uniref:zinc finger protein 557-like n=1 Tax=Peromyscus californicus insignis TaxID=564181 RepID=UPI0022A6804C|nr:zinc finger protein 557-like [Peromyscus californicus insignis]
MNSCNTVTYNEVHVDITQEEWSLMNPSQRNLYKDVMLETYMNLTAIGYNWEDLEVEEHCQSSQKHGSYIICHFGFQPYEHKYMKRSMKEVILQRNHLNTLSVGKSLYIIVIFQVIFKGVKEHILERNPVYVISVVKLSLITDIFKGMKEQMLE